MILDSEYLFSGEKIQEKCEMFIGRKQDIFCNPKFTADKRWIFIEDIKEEINNPKLIYIHGHRLLEFEGVIHNLKNNFILVSHNSDENIDDRFTNILNNNKLEVLHAQNLIINHPKALPLPIGIANSQWPHGNIEIFRKITQIPLKIESVDLHSTPNDIYFFFNTFTNSELRERCKLILSSKGLIWGKPQNLEEYLMTLRNHKFAICPAGNGIDTHRFWECILLGVIPIVESNPLILKLKPFYRMVILKSWEDFDINNIEVSLPWLNSMPYFQDKFFTS